MEEPNSVTIVDHESIPVDDEDDGHIEASKVEDDMNELEAKRKLFKFSKLGEERIADLKNLLEKVLQKFKDENKSKYKTKFDKFLNQKDDRGNTPQHYAAKGGHLEVIEVLDEKGANLQAKGQNDLTVIQFAARYGENEERVWKCIRMIIEMEKSTIWKPLSKGLDIDDQDKYGFNIIHHAIQNEHWKGSTESEKKEAVQRRFHN